MIRILAAKDLPEISRLVQASLTSSGLPIRVDTGEEFLVPTGADVYTRREGTNVIVGTESGAPPPFEGTGISGRVLDQLE